MNTDAPFSSDESSARPPGGRRIAQEAAEWIVRRDRGLSPQEARAFAAWQAKPRHAAELARIDRTWTGLDGIGAVPELETMADTILIRARAARRRRRRAWGIASTLAAAAAVALMWVQPKQPEPAPFAGSISENVYVIESTLRQQVLPDGSVAELNGASRIEVLYSAAERRVRLTEGEAHFIVAKDAARPFYVTAGPLTVRAVGTAFNVKLEAETVEVLVTEGNVKLARGDERAAAAPAAAPTEIAAGPAMRKGQRVVMSRREDEPAPLEVAEVPPAEIEEALGWQSTRLVFNNTSLDEVVEGFNRYNKHQLTLGDPALRSRKLTGVFRADNLEGFVRLLRASVDVKAEQRTPLETVLLPVP